MSPNIAYCYCLFYQLDSSGTNERVGLAFLVSVLVFRTLVIALSYWIRCLQFIFLFSFLGNSTNSRCRRFAFAVECLKAIPVSCPFSFGANQFTPFRIQLAILVSKKKKFYTQYRINFLLSIQSACYIRVIWMTCLYVLHW